MSEKQTSEDLLRPLLTRRARSSRRCRFGVRLGLIALLVLLTAPEGALVAQGIAIDRVEVASNLFRPVVVTHAGDGTGRLFIAQQTGEILILKNGNVLSTPFLDLSALITGGTNEQGLLGLAFHPDYADTDNGYFFVSYTEPESSPPPDCPVDEDPDATCCPVDEDPDATCDANSVVARYQVSSGNDDVADPASAQILFKVNQERTNHNGGHLAFDPDGYLYLSFGDGGGGGDPFLNGQDLTTLGGSILRIDVDGSPPAPPNNLCGLGAAGYGIPADNPFVGVAGACDEIWSYGLRNPWRFSFDRETGDVFIGDVGQGAREEIDFQLRSSTGGENYGWNCYEGTWPYPGGETCSGSVEFPIFEYPHSNPSDPTNTGRSVTGGYRYRGALHPRLDGVYLYADFVEGRIWGSVPRCDGVWESRLFRDEDFLISTFGEDEAGEIYMTRFQGGSSKVFRLQLAANSGGPDIAPSPAAVDFGSNVQVGTLSAREVVITNANLGPEALFVADLASSDPTRFQIDPAGGSNPCSTTAPCLSPGESCTISVAFAPTAAGPASESLTAIGNSEPETVDLTGAATTCLAGSTRTVTGGPFADARTEEACATLAAGPYEVIDGGNVQLRAGSAIELRDGFSVSGTAQLELAVDPALLP